MPTTDLLKSLGLYRNPFTDRTAEKTAIDPLSVGNRVMCMRMLCVLLPALVGGEHCSHAAGCCVQRVAQSTQSAQLLLCTSVETVQAMLGLHMQRLFIRQARQLLACAH